MAGKRNNERKLTPAEQKTTTAFKLLTEQNRTLRQSLKRAQDELESYRAKYYEAEKNHAIQTSRNSTLIFHEILKFVVSIVFGGIGVNLFTAGKVVWGVGAIALGIVLYAVIVVSDRYKK